MKKDFKEEKKNFDVIVIGAGSGGLNIAGFANRIGLKVLLIDKTDKSIGGDCLNFGCVPSKVLVHVARCVRQGRALQEFGIQGTGTLDMKAVMSHVRGRQEIFREHENADWFRKKGMHVVLGSAKFVGRNKISVGDTIYEGKRIVLATGSRPRKISLPGMERVKVFNNENIFNIDFLPKNFVVIGGGPIGMEIGQAFQSLGSQVSILEQGDKFLPKEDRDITDVLYKRLIRDGIKVLFNTQAKEINEDGALVVTVGAKEQLLPVDALFVAAGRELNLEALDFNRAGVELDQSGTKLVVDSYLLTTNKKIAVCGDLVGQYQFTHAAELHATVIIRNLFSPFKKKLSNKNLSWVTYTDPEIASFGLSSQELKEQGVPHETVVENFSNDDRAIIDGYREGLLKINVSKRGKILGGTMVAPYAGEITQELMLAQTHGMSLANLFAKIYPYPTATRINKRLAGNYMGRRLTSRSKIVLRLLFRIFG